MIVKFRGPHKHIIELSGVQCIEHVGLYDAVIKFYDIEGFNIAKREMDLTDEDMFEEDNLLIHVHCSSTVDKGYKINYELYTYFDVEEE